MYPLKNTSVLNAIQVTCKSVARPKFLGSAYFILLALVNLGGTLWNGHIGILDIIFLFLALLPVLINKKGSYLLFGWLHLSLWLYLLLAIGLSHTKDNTSQSANSIFPYIVGYTLTVCSLFFSGLLIKAGSGNDI